MIKGANMILCYQAHTTLRRHHVGSSHHNIGAKPHATMDPLGMVPGVQCMMTEFNCSGSNSRSNTPCGSIERGIMWQLSTAPLVTQNTRRSAPNAAKTTRILTQVTTLCSWKRRRSQMMTIQTTTSTPVNRILPPILPSTQQRNGRARGRPL